MPRQLAAHVILRDPDSGRVVAFGPEDDVPAWAVELITNPDVWADDVEEVATSVDDRPPTSGKGSGRDAWAAYAEASGVTVVEGMNREDIIAALPDPS